jgi:hypothetical protein
MSENVGASTSRNLKGLHGLYRDNLTFTYPISNEPAAEVHILFICPVKFNLKLYAVINAWMVFFVTHFKQDCF